MTRLTADEITTFAEVFGAELTLAQMTHLETWVDAHRAEAVVMHEMEPPRECPHGCRYYAPRNQCPECRQLGGGL
jgi:hypothetical protein